MTRRSTLLALAAVGLVCLAVAGAWVLEWAMTGDGDVYHVVVVQDDAVLAEFDIGQLEALGTHRVKMQGKYEEGPSLLAVLEAAGVDDFGSVVIVGAGVRDRGRLQLEREQIDDNVLLDIANRGTCKVAGPDIAWQDRVRDVTRIEVR